MTPHFDSPAPRRSTEEPSHSLSHARVFPPRRPQFENTRLAAYPLAGAVSGLGVRSLVDYNITGTLQALIEDKSQSVPREAALFASQLLAVRLGRTFEPYVPQLMTLALACLGENQANVRDAADSCCQAFAGTMAPTGVGCAAAQTPLPRSLPARCEKMATPLRAPGALSLCTGRCCLRMAPLSCGRGEPSAGGSAYARHASGTMRYCTSA